jgi:excinuclease ABC subunit A
MSNNIIRIRGARTHNLKNINLDLKMNAITCVAGPSGSGKSSLAFHTLFAESKRRYINSLPTEMKFFWEVPQSTDVDEIFPVLPVWGLAQHNPILNSRPVALDILGGHERVQKIFKVLGKLVCPKHDFALAINDMLLVELEKFIKKYGSEGEHLNVVISREVYRNLLGENANPVRSFDGKKIHEFDLQDNWYELFRLKLNQVDELKKKLSEYGDLKDKEIGFVFSKSFKFKFIRNEIMFSCPECDYSSPIDQVKYDEELSPLNAMGACSECEGHGMKLVYDREKLVKDTKKSIREGAVNILNFSHFQYVIPDFFKECKKNNYNLDIPFEDLPMSIWDFLYKGSGKYPGLNEYFSYFHSKRYQKNIRIYSRGLQTEVVCQSCLGTRVSSKIGSVCLEKKKFKVSYRDFLKLSFKESLQKILEIKKYFEDEIAHFKLQNNFSKLIKLYESGCLLKLDHLPNIRKVKTLSSGEYQRLLLTKFLSYEGSQSLFVLDEPSLGLSHDAQKILMNELRKLRDQGNTILIVEHSEVLKSMSDEIIEMGPLPGNLGGEIVYQGPYVKSKNKKIEFEKRSLSKDFIEIKKIKIRSLERDELKIAKNRINWVVGEAGSGKTSVILNVLANAIHKEIKGTKLFFDPFEYKSLKGISDIKDVIVINGSIEKVSSRSTVATYTELGGFVRKYFASLEISKKLELKDGHFSSNSELGMCLSCEGRGVKIVEMHFMEDVAFVCEDCKGMKIKPYYATISDGNINAYEAFNLPMNAVIPNIHLTPKGKRIWDYLKILNIDYLSLERTLISLSGGERQRLYLMGLLNGKIESSVIVFENLTSGLSIHEFQSVAKLLQQLTANNNTLIIVDQNPLFEEIVENKIIF